MAEQRVDIEIRTTADTSGVTQAEQALRKVDTAAKQAGQGTTVAGQAAKATSTELRGLTQAGAGLNQTMTGLAQGGIAGVITAFRGLATAIKGLFASGLGAIAIPLGLAAAAFYALGKAADNAREKLFGTGERTKAIAGRMKELAEASEKYVKKAAEDAKALAEAYDRATSSIDAALSRYKEVESARLEAEVSQIEAERQVALSKATSPEERAKINAQYDDVAAGARRGSSNQTLDKEFEAAAKGRTEALTKKRVAADSVSAAEARVAAAAQAVEKAKASGDYYSIATAQNQEFWARQDLDKVRETSGKQVDEADRAIADNDARLSALGYRQQAATNNERAEAVGTMISRRDSERAAAEKAIPGLTARYNQLEEESRGLTPGWNNQRSAEIGAEMSKIAAERDAAYQAIGNFAQSEAKARTELERNLQNTSESGAGR